MAITIEDLRRHKPPKVTRPFLTFDIDGIKKMLEDGGEVIRKNRNEIAIVNKEKTIVRIFYGDHGWSRTVPYK